MARAGNLNEVNHERRKTGAPALLARDALEAGAGHDAPLENPAEGGVVMARYSVCWTIDIDDVATPQEAAEQAWKHMRAAGSIANHFRVTDQAGTIDTVDLLEAYGTAGRPEDLADQAPKLLEFAKWVTRLSKDGEQMDDGSKFEMENDDAVDTVHALISAARELLGVEDPPMAEPEDECSTCGRTREQHDDEGYTFGDGCNWGEQECTCDDRSWHGSVHDDDCDFAGEAR